MARAARQPLDVSREIVADRIEEQPEAQGLRWSRVLTIFMRLLALIWIVKGLASWAAILGMWPTAGFEGRAMGVQATLIYFAVIDLLAAVGLWMASTWGGVLWLLAVMSHVILAFFFPRIVTGGLATTIFVVTTIVLYLAVSWLAARERE